MPEVVVWPLREKTDEVIFQDMLNQGGQMNNVTLKLGDGSSARIQLPIK